MGFRLLAIVALAGLLAASCGSPDSPGLAQVAGNWTGNMQSSNWAAATVNVVLSQSAGAVTGTWTSAALDWNGTISGTVTPTDFTGTFTISVPTLGVGGRCTGNGTVSGAAGGASVRWTGPGFTGSCSGLPVNLTWNLQH